MKIRIKGDSIRYRLTQTEVKTFCEKGIYTETTHFRTSIFTYALQAKEGITALQAEFNDHTITLFLPREECSVWSASDRIGYQNAIPLGDGKELSLLLEKDFACLDNTTEDQSDNYPNPKGGTDTC